MAKTFKTYKEKLRDPRWQQKRLDVLNRDEWTCQLCGDKKTELHIHHFCYDVETRDPWNVDDSALITYCKSCHAYVESIDDGFSVHKVFKTVVGDKYAVLRAFGFFGSHPAINIAKHDYESGKVDEFPNVNNEILEYAIGFINNIRNR